MSTLMNLVKAKANQVKSTKGVNTMTNLTVAEAKANNVEVMETMTSYDFMQNFINPARIAEGKKPQRHNRFLEKVVDELEGEKFGYRKMVAKTGKGKEELIKVAVLNLEQCLLMGMRESKGVRKAVLAKLKQLEAENKELKNLLSQREQARVQHKPMMKALEEVRTHNGKETKFYHYSNESNMINRIVLGSNAAKFKRDNNIGSNEATRDYLEPLQLEVIAYAEKMNESLIEAGLGYNERKEALTRAIERKFGASLAQIGNF